MLSARFKLTAWFLDTALLVYKETEEVRNFEVSGNTTLLSLQYQILQWFLGLLLQPVPTGLAQGGPVVDKN